MGRTQSFCVDFKYSVSPYSVNPYLFPSENLVLSVRGCKGPQSWCLVTGIVETPAGAVFKEKEDEEVGIITSHWQHQGRIQKSLFAKCLLCQVSGQHSVFRLLWLFWTLMLRVHRWVFWWCSYVDQWSYDVCPWYSSGHTISDKLDHWQLVLHCPCLSFFPFCFWCLQRWFDA